MFGSDDNRTQISALQSQKWVAMLFLFIFFQYFLGTSLLHDVPIIELMWLMLLVILFLFSKSKNIILIGLIYFILAIFYTTGLAFDSQGLATAAYYRTILTSFIYSALLFSILTLDLRRLRGKWKSLNKLPFVQFAIIVIFSGWAMIGIQDLNNAVLTDFRDITGAGYLTLADSFALFSIAYLCRERLPPWEFVLVFGLSAVVIFLLGSRTAMVLYPVAVVFIIGRHVSFIGVIGWALLFCSAAFFWFASRLTLESSAFFRFDSLFLLGSDESLTVRNVILDRWLDQLTNNPECFILACHPEEGWYVHNILSVVQYFGLAGIIFLVGTVFVIVVRFSYLFRQWYFPILLYCVVSLFFSRSWVTVVFPVFLALVADIALGGSAIRRHRIIQTAKND